MERWNNWYNDGHAKRFIKKGVILPNNERDWESANEFFRSSLHHKNEILDIDHEVI